MNNTIPQVPKGWFADGSAPQDYETGTDKAIFHSGTTSGYLKSKIENPQGFGNLMQQCTPGEYSGKRVKLSAFIKTKNVENWAGLWMRVDGKDNGEFGFDNMQDRPIKGTTDWTKYEIVLDVPKESITIAFGILIEGKGYIWLDDVMFEVVDEHTPLTATPFQYPPAPINLQFED